MSAKEKELVTTGSNALMAIINRASTDAGFDVAKLESLLAMKERWDKEEARKEFVVAMTDFKANPPEVMKSHQVSFGNTSYKHATLDQASSIIGATASQHGLSHRWSVDQSKEGKIKVTCTITHVLGHSENVTLEAQADQSGGKNAIQAIASAVTYLERYTLFAAYGIAAKDQDDDGRGASQSQDNPLSQDLPRRAAVEPVKITDPVKFHVEKVTRQKTEPIQFRIAATDGAIYYSMAEDIALQAKSAGESKSEVTALLTKKGDALWIDSIDTQASTF